MVPYPKSDDAGNSNVSSKNLLTHGFYNQGIFFLIDFCSSFLSCLIYLLLGKVMKKKKKTSRNQKEPIYI